VPLEDDIARLGFSVWQPEGGRAGDRRLAIPRHEQEDAKLVQLPRAPVDVTNVVLPPGLDSLHGMLAPECRMERMSTFAVAALINRAVARMSPDHSYVNVGTWMGFSLWAGMHGNPDRTCAGVDDFSMFGGPREAFHEWFDRLRSPTHHFHEMDYRDYFDRVHEGPIGVYFYDGDHTYEHQLLGLRTAERFFGDDCVVIVDDTNWVEPYEATYDFVAESERGYRVLLDQQTVGNGHPTFWNGLLILRTSERTRSTAPARGSHKPWQWDSKQYAPVPVEPEPPLVSLVLRNSRSGAERLEVAVENAKAQRWPALEVVVAEDGEAGTIRRAIDCTRGDYVGIADVEDELLPSAVEIGLAFPQTSEFNRDPADPFLEGLRRSLDAVAEAFHVVPRGGSLAFANARLPVPLIDSGRTIVPLLDAAAPEAPPSDDGLVGRLAGLRESGTDFLVLGWRSFDWLERFPRFRDELEERARRVLESENAAVFELKT
jgi:hypothetical protein